MPLWIRPKSILHLHQTPFVKHYPSWVNVAKKHIVDHLAAGLHVWGMSVWLRHIKPWAMSLLSVRHSVCLSVRSVCVCVSSGGFPCHQTMCCVISPRSPRLLAGISHSWGNRPGLAGLSYIWAGRVCLYDRAVCVRVSACGVGGPPHSFFNPSLSFTVAPRGLH